MTTMNPETTRLVWLHWIDSAQFGSGWRTVEPTDDLNIAHCYSVGWVERKTDDYISVTPHVSCDDGPGSDAIQGMGTLSIPIIAIIEMRDIQFYPAKTQV